MVQSATRSLQLGLSLRPLQCDVLLCNLGYDIGNILCYYIDATIVGGSTSLVKT